MNTSRRNFLRIAGITGAGALSGAFKSDFGTSRGQQHFNMSGYGALVIETVRIGFIGLGMRGPGAVERMCHIEGVEIKAFCDERMERVESAQRILEGLGLPPARAYGGNADAWKDLCNSDDIDLVYICTPWSLHTPMAVYAMEHGKHAAIEVPAATTMEDAWLLVETSEKTRKHCMMLENCCYDFFELLTLNMARQGFFGEVVHTEAAYIHNLSNLNFSKKAYTDMWRLKENQRRNGNLYPTHGLGPVCQVLNINRGDRMDYLTSMSCHDFQLADMAAELAKNDSFYSRYATRNYRGNMNTTLVCTEKGKTIMIQHDTTSPRPYSRIHLISGTKAMACKYPEPGKISHGHAFLDEKEMAELNDAYAPEIVKRIGDMAQKIGGHGGMDFLMDWRLIDCLRNGLPLDQDVYDAALWSCIAPLSEWSVAHRSDSIDIPDFTRGSYKTNSPVDLTLFGGGTTGIKAITTDSDKQLDI